MLQYLRKDRPTKPKPLGRRLAIQHLEKRLALSSSTGGGFVDLSTSFDGFSLSTDPTAAILISSDSDSGIAFGEFFDLADDAWAIANSQDALVARDESGSHLDSVIKIIKPPGILPGSSEGGTVPVKGKALPEELPTSTQEVGETSVFQKSSFSTVISLQKLSLEIAPSRGRDISFNVATVAPPRSILKPKLTTIAASEDRPQVEIASRSAAEATMRQANDSSRAIGAKAEKSPGSTTKVPLLESSQTRAMKPPVSVSLVSRSSSPELEHDASGANQSASTKTTLKGEPLSTSMPALIESPEEEARSQVFADWRSRDLIALPVLVALATGSRLLRSLRNPTDDTQQLPPKRTRQTASL